MTARWPHLKKAPIVEATIDFRVAGRPELSLDELDLLTPSISDAYPEKQSRVRLEGGFQLGKPSEARTSEHRDGFVYTSKARGFVFQSQLEGFTISKQAPYDNWVDLFSEAQNLWGQYRAIAKPAGVTRVGVRFINQLQLPAALRDYKDFLTAPPEVPARLDQHVVSFISRIVVPIVKLGAFAAITQSSGNSQGAIQPVILDIDVFKQEIQHISADEAWSIVDKFHDEKNRIFFESITERMVELCLPG